MSQPPSDPDQEMNIADSSLQGQIGQAGRDITQNQGSGNIYKDITIYNFPERRDAQQKDSDKGLTRQEYKNRQALLNNVRNYWIKGFLEKSLSNRLKIELGLEERLDAVESVGETPEHTRQALEPGTKAIAKFDELRSIGRTLLILGEPGSGKTITLLEIAQELIERSEKDPQLPIPVVFNLSSWNRSKGTIKDWLIQEFETGIYKVSREVSKNWIQNQQLLLLMDGLDEVRQEFRESCVEAINRFSQEHGQTEIIVCSRVKAYQALPQLLRFQTALVLNPLTSEQIEEYLTQAGERLTGIKLALLTDSVLQELAQSPLMLSIMVLAYEDMPASAFAQMNLEERQQHLWDKYIDRMLERKQNIRYPKNVTLNWLGFLAQQTMQESQTLFLIEHINPNWLKSGIQHQIYPLVVGLLAGLLTEWVYGFPLGLIAGQLSFQMLIGLMTGIALAMLSSLSSKIRLFTTIGWTWSREKAWKAVIPGILSGPLIGVLIWLLGRPLSLVSQSLLYYLKMGFYSGIVIALLSALFTGLVSSRVGNEIDASLDSFTDTNQGIWQSGIRAGVATLFTLATIILPIAILYSWFLPLSAFLACVSLYAGGTVCLQHLSIRFVLWQNRNSPWNYTDFLNHSTERMLLQKSGGGYQFIHNLLQRQIVLKYKQGHLQKSKINKILGLKLFLIYTTLLVTLISSLILPLLINTWKVPISLEQIFAPRLYQGDRLLIERISYHFVEPQRWDIVSFQSTDKMRQQGFKYYRAVRQILGFEEEEIAIVHGKIYVNGKLEDRVFVPPIGFREHAPVKVPKGMYLVSINNSEYDNPKDEFIIHLIPKNCIDGRAIFRFWPPDRTGYV